MNDTTRPVVARFRYSKLGKIRFTSHRDVGRMWERALRRVALAVAYTSGFSPRPRIAFGFALPTGAESTAEYVDIALEPEPERLSERGIGRHDIEGLPARLSPALPDGIEVTEGALLAASTPALQAAVSSSTWELTLTLPNFGSSSPLRGPFGTEVGVTLGARVDELLARATVEIEIERKGTMVPADIRPGIISAEVRDDGVVMCELAARGTRPSDFIRALGDDPLDARILRTSQMIEKDGARDHPLGLAQVLREEPTDHVRPEPFPALASASPPTGYARGA